MISKLHIQNYAIIDELHISFEEGLNIITGETGAGKSILMGALNLILGQRADSQAILNPEKKCFVEGLFTVKESSSIRNFFIDNDLDYEENIIIRREISSNGKSRSFINDTPVNLSQIKTLGIHLVDLHQQFDTMELSSENFQREVLDALAENQSLLNELGSQYQAYSEIKKELNRLKQLQENANKELDYHQYLFDELDQLQLKENELEQLEAELKLLNNAESFKAQLLGIYHELVDAEQPVTNTLKSLNHKLKSLHTFHATIDEMVKRLSESIIELEDIAAEIGNLESSVRYDAERIAIINERLGEGYRLLKKHALQHTSQLIELAASLQLKIEANENVFASIQNLEKDLDVLEKSCLKIAAIISKNRSNQIQTFTDSVNELLDKVGMPNAKLKVKLTNVQISESGTDAIDFLFDANKSNKFESLGKVASGGELSRLMLSIKSLVAKKLALPTLIFDEIDTGISGEAAKQVGIIMKDLSASHQLIAITHQAQIAAKASTHYFVYKESKDNMVKTGVRVLNREERVMAIAKMLSGEKPTAAAIENAKEMVVS